MYGGVLNRRFLGTGRCLPGPLKRVSDFIPVSEGSRFLLGISVQSETLKQSLASLKLLLGNLETVLWDCTSLKCVISSYVAVV